MSSDLPGVAAIERLLSRLGLAERVIDVVPLGPDAGKGAGAKGSGYGRPLKVVAEQRSRRRTFVLHTVTSNALGHDRRADRIDELYLAHDTWRRIPHHVQPIDVGFVVDGEFTSAGAQGEPWLLSPWAEGRPYAEDLRRVVADGADGADLARCRLLANTLVALHAQAVDAPAVYRRSIRDLLGHGEGIFGVVDSYPPGVPGAPPARLEAIERLCLKWRWRLRGQEHRLARIHGDFHPFNILFDEAGQLSLVDASRGCAGDPADDVAALAINYVFFAADTPARWPDFSRLWHAFWHAYLEGTKDTHVLEVIAPFLAWRALVVANPLFYPQLSVAGRGRLLGFAERVLEAPRFDPAWADALF